MMRSAGVFRVTPRMHTCVRFLPRVGGIIVGLICLMELTACMGPVKSLPVPQSQTEKPSPSTKTTGASKALEPAPSAGSDLNAPVLPHPLIGSGPSIEDENKKEGPVVETKPEQGTVQDESNKLDKAIPATDESAKNWKRTSPGLSKEHVETLPEVLVPGFKLAQQSYALPKASTATKTPTPVMQTPLSIQVVSPQILKDQQAIQLIDGVKNVSGVLQGNSQGGFAEEFIIRGFNTNFANYVDGLRLPASRLPTALADRIEVLKGAAANLYGRIEPGGMINMVLKRPQTTPGYSLQQQFGSYELYRTTADATGPLTMDKSLQYRFNLEYLNAQSFRDFVSTERILVSPSLRWELSDDTRIDVDYFYSDEDTVNDWIGVPAIGNRPANTPISRFLGEPSLDTSNTKLSHLGTTVTHRLTEGWDVKGRFVWLNRDVVDRVTSGNALNETTGVLSRDFFGSQANSNTYYGTIDLTGRFSSWNVTHHILIGWDIYSNHNEVTALSTASSPINIFNPSYGTSGINLSTAQNNFFLNQSLDWTGVYFQDHITLWDHLHILGGGRYDWATFGLGLAFGTDQSLADARAAHSDVENKRFSPRVGVLYQPWEWLSVFGNYTESLGAANNGFSASGKQFDPQVGKQYEAGIKAELFDRRLTSSVAFFHLTKDNLLVPIAGSPFSRAIGEARSRGVEVDMAGQITDALSLIATYAYTDAEITKGENKGNRLFNAAKHMGSVWTKYDIQHGPLTGLAVGAGIYLYSKRQGDAANTFALPGYGRVDTMVQYQFPLLETQMALQFNIMNLLDKEYYESTINDRFTITPGAPRTFIGSLQIVY